jgi:hypothetical protein
MARCGKIWNDFDANQKAVYEEKHLKDKLRHQKQCEELD